MSALIGFWVSSLFWGVSVVFVWAGVLCGVAFVWVCGGLVGREGLCFGCGWGCVLCVFVDPVSGDFCVSLGFFVSVVVGGLTVLVVLEGLFLSWV